MKLVTTIQAQRHLRIDDLTDTEIEQDLEDKILQSSHLVLDYLKVKDLSIWQDSNGDPLNVPYLVQCAVLIWLGILWNNRNGESPESLQLGEVPRTVSNLLYRYRVPAFG